jgi:hypothetical protein
MTDCVQSTRPAAPCKPFFAMVPTDVATDPRLIDRDRTLLAHLISYAWGGKATCNPGNRRLAGELGCCPRTVQLSLGRLERAVRIRRESVTVLDADGRPTTSRTIVLVWREADCAPPAQSDGHPPAQRPAPESRGKRETRTAPAGSGSPGPGKRWGGPPLMPTPPRYRPPAPLPVDALDLEQVADLLARPADDPFRRLAETMKTRHAAAAGPPGAGGLLDVRICPAGPAPGRAALA